MAQHWADKSPDEVAERRWRVPVVDGEGLASFETTASGVSVEVEEVIGDECVIALAGGTAGTTATVTITATGSQGFVYVETFYQPIMATTTALSNTARAIVGFALRKVTGNGVDPEASELSDALERLNDMLASWKGQGADVGVPLPLVAGTVLYCPDEFVVAVKNNLILQLADLYEYQPGGMVIENARRGLQLVKSANFSRGDAHHYF